MGLESLEAPRQEGLCDCSRTIILYDQIDPDLNRNKPKLRYGTLDKRLRRIDCTEYGIAHPSCPDTSYVCAGLAVNALALVDPASAWLELPPLLQLPKPAFGISRSVRAVMARENAASAANGVPAPFVSKPECQGEILRMSDMEAELAVARGFGLLASQGAHTDATSEPISVVNQLVGKGMFLAGLFRLLRFTGKTGRKYTQPIESAGYAVYSIGSI